MWGVYSEIASIRSIEPLGKPPVSRFEAKTRPHSHKIEDDAVLYM